jgi:dipeptide/tripeptide permease
MIRGMKKPLSLLIIVLVVLAAYALIAAGQALHRRQVMLFVVLMAISVIFWTRSRKKP